MKKLLILLVALILCLSVPCVAQKSSKATTLLTILSKKKAAVTPVDSLTLTTVSTFASISYYITGADSDSCTVQYKEADSTTWHDAYVPVYDSNYARSAKEWRGSIVNLSENTTYSVHAKVYSGGSVVAEKTESVTTWTDSPTILRTHNIGDIYTSGALTISDSVGTNNGWIRILGDGVTVIDGGAPIWTPALTLNGCKYLILENLVIRGGRHGVLISDEGNDHIRLINCDISGWGRTPVGVNGDGNYVDAEDNTIMIDAGVFIQGTSCVVERSYIHDPRGYTTAYGVADPLGPVGIVVATTNSVLRYNDVLGSSRNWLADGVETYPTPSDGLAKDCDVEGNLFAYSNDDGIEADGPQTNLRVKGNLFEANYSGISDAPNTVGPSYFWRNVVTRGGDSLLAVNPAIKLGGGTTWSKGRSFFFNNTSYYSDDVFVGVGFGADAIGVKEKYIGTTRNNIFYTNGTNKYALDDEYESNGNSSVNDQDYDLLHDRLRAKAADETHAMWAHPAWTDTLHNIFTLAAGSKGIDSGVVVSNFTDGFAGSAPDMGAYEYGSGSLTLDRPVSITADKYRLVMTAGTPDTVTLTVGTLVDSTYVIKKASNMGWLTVSPASGELVNNQAFVFSANMDSITKTERGTAFIRLANGYSLPISIEAAPSPFLPSDSAGLEVWVVADSITGKSNGDTLGTWASKGQRAFSYTQTTDAKKPSLTTNALNGHAAVTFASASGHFLTGTARTDSIKAASVWIVLKKTTDVTSLQYIACFGSNNQSIINANGLEQIHWYNKDAEVNMGASSTSFTLCADTAGNSTTSNNAVWSVGATATGTVPTGASIAEMIVYDHAATATLKAAINAYINRKYGL